MTGLSQHFTYEEMIESQTASRHGLDNSPPLSVIGNLRAACQQAEAVRALLGRPMLISSGYRSPQLNYLLRGVPTSAHCQGWAMDFICPGFGSPLQICRAIQKSGIKIDQCIQEGAWVHLSFAPAMRQEFLTAKFDKGGATYQEGLVA